MISQIAIRQIGLRPAINETLPTKQALHDGSRHAAHVHAAGDVGVVATEHS